APVQEDQVEVAARGELLAPVAAHGDERHVGLGAEQAGEFAVQLSGARGPCRPERGAGLGRRGGDLAARRGDLPPPAARPPDPVRHAYSASGPVSPVRTRTTVSTGTDQTLPSPILPVWAALTMTSTMSSASSPSTRTSTRSLGTRSTLYSAPR